jgi:tRNA threonylcarbamoyladenosine modification (KEOPS) complex  Pcc1 subunit
MTLFFLPKVNTRDSAARKSTLISYIVLVQFCYIVVTVLLQ